MSLPPIIGRLVADTSDFSRGMRNAVGIVGGAFAAVGAAKFLGGAMEEMEEAQKVGKQTAAVIKSTGGAANQSAKQVDDLASSLSVMAGIDDEVIAGSQNVLMTFTAVRNEVGKGNDVFNQATKAALNMSVAMGSDLQTATMQVGKALNDPIKGVGALRKAGVQLTQQQEDSIKTMVAQGDTLGAQKIILKELETQFGGSAEAQATASAKMRVAWGNLQESAGKAIAPILSFLAGQAPKLFSWIEDTAGSIATKLAPAFAKLNGAAKQIFTIFAKRDFVGGPFAEDSPFINGVFKVRDAIVDFAQKAQGVFAKLKGNLEPILAGIAAVILAVVVPALASLVVGVVAAAAPFIALAAVVALVWPKIKDHVIGAVQAIVGWVQREWPRIQEIVTEVMHTVASVIRGVVDVILALWDNFGSQIVNILKSAWDFVMDIVSAAMKIIRGVIDVVAGLITGDWGRVWDGIKGILAGVWDAMKAVISTAIDIIKEVIKAGWEIVKGIFTGAWDGLKTIVREAVAWVVDKIIMMAEKIVNAAEFAFGWIPFIGDKIKGLADKIEQFRNDVNASLRGIDDKVINISVRVNEIRNLSPGISLGAAYHEATMMAEGGLVRARPGGTIIRAGEGGEDEWVIPASKMGTGAGYGSGVNVTVNVYGSILTEKELVATVRDGLIDMGRHVPSLFGGAA